MSDSFGLIKGLKVTFKELFRKSVTDKYPKEFRKNIIPSLSMELCVINK